MQNQPLNHRERAKITRFITCMVLSLFIYFGQPPAALLVYGVYKARKNRDFTKIQRAVKQFKIYTWLCIAACLLAIGSYGFKLWTGAHCNFSCDGEIYLGIFLLLVALFYLFAVQSWFYKPLEKHSQWVIHHGIFKTTG